MSQTIEQYKSDIESIEKGITWLVENESPSLCRIKRDKEYKKSIAIQIQDSSEYFNVPPLLITGMMYRESVFNTTVIGPIGELGLLQVGKMGRGKCKEYCGKMKTIKEQIDCGCCWLDMGSKWCKDLHGGLSAYVCGKCKPKYKKSKRAYNIRIRLWEKLKNL